MASTARAFVVVPDEGILTYGEGAIVNLVANPRPATASLSGGELPVYSTMNMKSSTLD